ncbi:MFS transporter [Streptomyces sp. NPDC059851]|uniref:MFS transporter n=1 Tax=Streptomyces sp. NPDC059851 TaxID=3346971 RepID=UPI003666694D
MTSSIRRLLAGRTAAALATALIPTTLTLAVVPTGSAGDLGVVLASELLPMLLLLPVAGVVADRHPARRVVLAADLVRAAAQAATGILLLTGPVRIGWLAVLAAVTGAGVAFGNPSVRTLVATVVPAPDRLRVNSRLAVAGGLAQIAGPAAAGGMMLALGAGWSSLLTAALFAASALTLGGLRPTAEAPGSAGSAGGPAARAGFAAELRGGWAEARRHPWFLANVLAHGVWHFAAGLLLALGPLIAVESLGGAGSWVVIAQAGTVGMLVGVWAAGRLPIRSPLHGVAVGAAVQALPLAALALRLPLAVTAAAHCVALFGLGVLSPLWETELQRRIPLEALGRVGSLDSLISFAVRPVGLAAAAPLAGVTGTAAPLLAAAALTAAANLGVLLLPDIRRQSVDRDPVRTLR